VELTDGVVTLRRFRDDDVPRIVEACSDPDTACFILLIPVPYGEQEAKACCGGTSDSPKGAATACCSR
jgi:hypothetical protein